MKNGDTIPLYTNLISDDIAFPLLDKFHREWLPNRRELHRHTQSNNDRLRFALSREEWDNYSTRCSARLCEERRIFENEYDSFQRGHLSGKQIRYGKS